MGWHRGVCVCTEDVAEKVEKWLSGQGSVCRLGSSNGEVGFAFSGRDAPDLDDLEDSDDGACIAAISDSGPQYIWSQQNGFDPKFFVPVLSLTVGLSLDNIKAVEDSPFLHSMLAALREPAESRVDGERADFRWDIEAPCGDSTHQIFNKKLAGLARQLEESGIAYRATIFDRGWGTELGDLDESTDPFTGPAACISIDWSDADGRHSVAATDCEFNLDWDEAPESAVWDSA